MPILRALLLLCLTLGSTAPTSNRAQADDMRRTLFLGTAPVVGVYFPAGGAICSMINMARAQNGLRCAVESTQGSLANLAALSAGWDDIAIVQSDWQYLAVKGLGPFKVSGPSGKLRALFSLHGEPLTLVTRKNAGIAHLVDLKGKKVNVGPKGSGQRVLADILIHAEGWSDADFARLGEIDANLQFKALCTGEIDALLMPMSHPNGAVEEVAASCGAQLVSLNGPVVDKLLAEMPYLTRDRVPGGTYPGNPNDVATFGPRATLLTTTALPEEDAYQVVKAVFENFDRFRSMHPALRNLTPAEAVGPGNTAPFHEGALRYFRERHWLPP